MRRLTHAGGFLLLIVLLAESIRLPAAGQDSGQLDALLARPLSPGTLALLADQPVSERILARLGEALKDGRSDIRAAAARVVFALGLRGLVPAIVDALKAETELDAAVEQARVVAQFAGDEQLVIDAWKRLDAKGGAVMLYALALARGSESLRLLTLIRTPDLTEGTLATFIRLATRGARDATIALATDALGNGDRVLFSAVLASRDDRPAASGVGEELAVKGLAPGLPPAITFDTIRYVLRAWSPVRPMTQQLRTGLQQALDANPTPRTPRERLALELAARAVGRPPGGTPGWSDLVTNPPAEIASVRALDVVRSLLTDGELETIRKGLRLEEGSMRRPTRDELRGMATRAAATPPSLPMRLASGYPTGFISDVFNVTQCNIAEAQKTGVGEAVVTFRPDGRVSRIGIAEMKVAKACIDAVRVLMMTHVEAVDRVPPQEARIVTPFDAGFIACQNVPIPLPRELDSEGRIQPPKKTEHVAPVYPQAVIDQRIQGTVVIESVLTPTGCIAGANVRLSVDPRLDWAALRAVTAWRFSPALLNGTPVPLIMTVTVQFSLR